LLDAASNKLASVPAELSLLARLRRLTLDNNRISEFPAAVLKQCCELQQLSITDNPLLMETLRQVEVRVVLSTPKSQVLTSDCCSCNTMGKSPVVLVRRSTSMRSCRASKATWLVAKAAWTRRSTLSFASTLPRRLTIVNSNDTEHPDLSNVPKPSLNVFPFNLRQRLAPRTDDTLAACKWMTLPMTEDGPAELELLHPQPGNTSF
jgi:Leucine-rich repeat (LRR) protein